MTTPLEPQRDEYSQDTEFSWGKGLRAPVSRRRAAGGYLPPDGIAYREDQQTASADQHMTPYEQMKAIQNTDSAYEDAEADLAALPGTRNNKTQTRWAHG